MKNEIEILRGRHGTYTAVARALGISYRHLINVRNEEKTSKLLKMHIKSIITDQTQSGGDPAPKREGAA